jgi:capsule polysaccharide export protein KpsE/RkpR
VRGARQDILKFRTENNNFDPSQMAATSLEIVGQLESELSQLKSQMASVATYLAADAPTVAILQSKISALEEEISRKNNEFSAREGSQPAPGAGKPMDGALASVVAQYQDLLLSQEFAERPTRPRSLLWNAHGQRRTGRSPIWRSTCTRAPPSRPPTRTGC